MFNYKYLTRDHLKGFDQYKYNSVDTSPFSNYVMHPFWNAIVEFTPNWIAPNLLTFAGFLCVVAEVLMFCCYDYWLTSAPRGEIPQWVYLAQSGLFFLAYTLDGIDGKQARKLGVSGPLGELFDHGLDSWIVFFAPLCQLSICGVVGDHSIPPFRAYLLIVNMLLSWHSSHVEKYNTGVLFLPWGYDPAMWSCTILFLIPGIWGLESTRTYILGIKAVNVAEIVIHLNGLTTFVLSAYNVHLSYKKRTGKMRSFIEAVRPLGSLIIVTGITTYWFLCSPGNILEYDLRMCLMMLGALYSNIACISYSLLCLFLCLQCRLIVSQMSGQRCDLLNWMALPLAAVAITSFLVPTLEYLLLSALTLVSVLAHVHYGVCVVRQICAYYGISCFSVKKPNKTKNKM